MQNRLSFNSRLAKKAIKPYTHPPACLPAQSVFGRCSWWQKRLPATLLSSSGQILRCALPGDCQSKPEKDMQRANICPNEILESPPKVSYEKQMKCLKTATALMSQEFCEQFHTHLWHYFSHAERVGFFFIIFHDSSALRNPKPLTALKWILASFSCVNFLSLNPERLTWASPMTIVRYNENETNRPDTSERNRHTVPYLKENIHIL